MKMIYFFAGVFFPILVAAQKGAPKNTNASYYKWLVGRWQNIDDSSDLLEFDRIRCAFLTRDDSEATLKFEFKLSTSCEARDSLQRSKFNELDNSNSIYLLLTDKEDHSLDDCYEIENLDTNTLSWMNMRTKRTFAYKKVIPLRKGKHAKMK